MKNQCLCTGIFEDEYPNGNVKSIWPQRDHLIWPHLARSMENLGSRNVQGCRNESHFGSMV